MKLATLLAVKAAVLLCFALGWHSGYAQLTVELHPDRIAIACM